MIRTLRALFLGTQLREKLLLVTFALIGLLWWLSAFSSRASAFNAQRRRTTLALAEQQQWLDNQKAIEAAARKAAEQLDAAKTLDGTRLLAKIGTLAREAGLRNTGTQGSPTTTSNGQFSIHTLTYSITNADWASLTKFYTALQQQSPYIGIDSAIVAAGQNNPAQLSLTLKVSSVEITR
jgi:hypothetical protein